MSARRRGRTLASRLKTAWRGKTSQSDDWRSVLRGLMGGKPLRSPASIGPAGGGDTFDRSLDNLASNAPIPDHMKERQMELFRFAFRWFLDASPVKPKRQWTVLEAGQGMYGWSELYQNFFDRVYGADLEDYSEYHPGVTSIQADFCQHIPLPDRSIDLVVSHSVLEHVADVPAALANFDRVLKVGGLVFITIYPLYYSPTGSHVRQPDRLSNWEHLDPASEYYLLDTPFPNRPVGGHFLNKMTFADFVGWVGRFPWSIEKTRLTIDPSPIPAYVETERWSEMDLRARGFFLLARKLYHFDARGPSGDR